MSSQYKADMKVSSVKIGLNRLTGNKSQTLQIIKYHTTEDEITNKFISEIYRCHRFKL